MYFKQHQRYDVYLVESGMVWVDLIHPPKSQYRVETSMASMMPSYICQRNAEAGKFGNISQIHWGNKFIGEPPFLEKTWASQRTLPDQKVDSSGHREQRKVANSWFTFRPSSDPLIATESATFQANISLTCEFAVFPAFPQVFFSQSDRGFVTRTSCQSILIS